MANPWPNPHRQHDHVHNHMRYASTDKSRSLHASFLRSIQSTSDDPRPAGQGKNTNATIDDCSCSWCSVTKHDNPLAPHTASIERQDPWLPEVGIIDSEAALSSHHDSSLGFGRNQLSRIRMKSKASTILPTLLQLRVVRRRQDWSLRVCKPLLRL